MNIPPEVEKITMAVLGLFPTTILARLLWHHRLVQLGERKFWSWDLAFEVPMAILCAVVGGGISEYLGLPLMATHGVAGVVGWLGPRGLEVIIGRLWVARYGKKD